MLTITIPGGPILDLAHLVLDFNGTIATDGEMADGVIERLTQLAEIVTIHVITADTHGGVRERLAGLPCTLAIIGPGRQDQAKLSYIKTLGHNSVVAIGNGRNDRKMLRKAALAIAIIGGEGACTDALQAADLACCDIACALDLLIHPARLQATLRN